MYMLCDYISIGTFTKQIVINKSGRRKAVFQACRCYPNLWLDVSHSYSYFFPKISICFTQIDCMSYIWHWNFFPLFFATLQQSKTRKYHKLQSLGFYLNLRPWVPQVKWPEKKRKKDDSPPIWLRWRERRGWQGRGWAPSPSLTMHLVTCIWKYGRILGWRWKKEGRLSEPSQKIQQNI